MSRLFVDANIFVYAVGGDELADRSAAALESIAREELDGVTSTAVLEEVWHLELGGRITGMEGQAERVYDLMTPLLAVDDRIVRRALSIDAAATGANDRVHAATCLEHGLAHILSADRGFDGIVELERVDPLDAARLAELGSDELLVGSRHRSGSD